MTAIEAVRASLRLLDQRARRRLGLAMVAQTTTTLLDLIGVVMVGAVGAIAANAVAGQPTPPRIVAGISALGLGTVSSGKLIAILAAVAALLLLSKSAINPILMARVYRFLARQQVAVSGRLTQELLARPLTFVHQRSSQETAAALGHAANAAVITILSQTVIAVAETTLLMLLAVALLIVNPALALGMIAYFGLLGIGVHRILGHRAAQLEAVRATADIDSLRTVQEAIGAYREITVANRRPFYVDHLKRTRRQSANAVASQQFFGVLPKYVSEAALVLGAFALAAVLFTTRPLGVAMGTFAIFLAAATRIMPSLLRLQGATLSVRSASGSAIRTFKLADDLGHPVRACVSNPDLRPARSHRYSDFSPTVHLGNVTFTYPGSADSAIRGVSLSVGNGDSVALVGRSGAGKSTLADLILGVLDADSGTVLVGGVPPPEAISRWPGGIAYVPQETMLTDASVRSNVALGLPRDVVDDDLVWDALRRARLADYVGNQPEGLDTKIGERGLRLSGGQRQRLGLARALFTRPRLIVLDEATSSLDAETEQEVGAMLAELEGDVTTVVVAHRLSTVRHADLVVYLDEGRVAAMGTFDEVCARVPALRYQAELMGINPGRR